MRPVLVTLGLLAAMPLCAQEQLGRWNLDVHTCTGTLKGHYIGTQSGEPFSVDLQTDLGLSSSGSKIGYGIEYQGHRFGLELSRDAQNFKGSQYITRQVTINGQAFGEGGLVTSAVNTSTTTFNWTIRCLSLEHIWLGIDLGTRVVTMDMSANGVGTSSLVDGYAIPGTTVSSAYSGTIPLPLVGLSAGFSLEGYLVGRAYYHTLQYSGASYNVTGFDLRFFPTPWLGIKGYTNMAKLRIPAGAISKDNADIALDQTGSGFGVVLRF